ncbi:hypothetical protein BC834DRAFT_491580 [Gloeopeniophorella convolvens]|nr:hypothetical protein BC834DRAFT_491580 [Gloeopeniophorella convolvens]
MMYDGRTMDRSAQPPPSTCSAHGFQEACACCAPPADDARSRDGPHALLGSSVRTIISAMRNSTPLPLIVRGRASSLADGALQSTRFLLYAIKTNSKHHHNCKYSVMTNSSPPAAASEAPPAPPQAQPGWPSALVLEPHTESQGSPLMDQRAAPVVSTTAKRSHRTASRRVAAEALWPSPPGTARAQHARLLAGRSLYWCARHCRVVRPGPTMQPCFFVRCVRGRRVPHADRNGAVRRSPRAMEHLEKP